TSDVVTPPSNAIVNLGALPLNQAPVVAVPLINTRKRSPPYSSASGSSKKVKNVESSRSGAHVVREYFTKAHDSLILVSFEAPSPAVVSKVGEFVPGTTSGAPKGLSFKGKKSVVLKKPVLVLRGGSKASASQSSASTRSEPLISSRLRPRYEPMAQHIPRIDVYDRANVAATWHITLFSEIRLRLKKAKLERSKLKRRLGRCTAALEKIDAELERLKKVTNEKPYEEVAQLRVNGCLRPKETNLATLNAKFQDILREKELLELRNSSFRRQVDGETEVKAEFTRMLDEQQQRFNDREFLVGKGFCYYLNKFKESDILGSRLGACISAAISDGMRHGLKAGFVHRKRGTDINSILAYNPNETKIYANALKALNDVSFPLLEQVEACVNQPFSYMEALLVMGVHEDIHDEAGTSMNPASGSTSFAGVCEVETIKTVETDDYLTGIALVKEAADTLATAPNVYGPNPAAQNLMQLSPFH
ncbi:hypothetical protein Tco_0461253, partial [Tanacetum coccineum]